MKNILITGGAGFIGSNFIKYLIKESTYNIVNLDKLTYAGNLSNLSDISSERYTFVKGDIRDFDKVYTVFNKFNIDTVVNFAAESHVDRSIFSPSEFVKTNVEGTMVLLECAKKYWSDKNQNIKEGVKFVQISTDEVYGSLDEVGKFSEKSPLSPNSPYSASKAAADMLVCSYYSTYNFPINITRCSNNYGPYQFPEKFIPLIANNCLNNRKIPIYGDGLNIRDWLYVLDHCSAVKVVMERGKVGEVYNIGGNNERTNLEIAKTILNIFNKSYDMIEFVQDRLGHDRRYAINNEKIVKELGWSPKYKFQDSIKSTIDWYIHNNEWLREIENGEYIQYYTKMYGGNL